MNDTTNQLYCLDDLRYLLAPEQLIKLVPWIIGARQGAYRTFNPTTGEPSLFVTQAGFDEILSLFNAFEVESLKYIVFHGVEISLMESGEVGLRAKDVATCFGYANHEKAIRKYCKSAKAGYISKADVCRLALGSGLTNAVRIRDWLIRGISSYASKKENN